MPTYVLSTPLQQARGVIGRYPDPDERYVFEFDATKPRTVHMLGIRRPLHVTFEAEGETTREVTLRPWVGWARAECDRIVEQAPPPRGF